MSAKRQKPSQTETRSSNKKVAEAQKAVAEVLVKNEVDQKQLAEVKALAAKLTTNLKGEGRIYTGDEHPSTIRFPTGVLAFDIVCGGGLPGGHLVEVFGPESSAKSLLCLESVAAAQRRGGIAAWLAGEGFDKDWAAKRGIDVENLFIIDGATGDTMLETALSLLESGALSTMVFDSFQSLGTTRESEAGVETEAYGNGGAPQMWGRIMRRAYRLAAIGKLTNTCMLGISQARSKIGGMSRGHVAEDGQPIQVRSIRHWKSISVRCVKGEVKWTEPNNKGSIYSREFKLRCEKNKTAGTDGFSAAYELRTREHEGVPAGIDNVETAFVHAVAYGLVGRSGSHYHFDGERVNGQEAAIAFLRRDPARAQLLSDKIRQMAAAGV